MKLVIATPLYPPEPGGPSTYAKLLEDGLPGKGIEPVLVKFGEVRDLPKLVRHLAYGWKVFRAARSARLVLALDPVSVGLPVMIACWCARKPYVVKVVGDYAWEQGTQRFGVTASLDEFAATPSASLPRPVRMLRSIEATVARRARKVLVPSPYLKDIVASWGIEDAGIEVINNAVTIPPTLPMPAKAPGEFLVVSTGRRVPWKGFEAIERIGKRREGEGWRVEIVSGKSRDEALGWVKAADAFVLNSTYEGFPHALVEAMTLGTPVVASANRGNAHLVEDGVTGLLVPVGDDAALERALEEVRARPEEAEARAARAKERMKSFEVPAMLEHTAHFLRNQAV